MVVTGGHVVNGRHVDPDIFGSADVGPVHS